MSVKRLVVRYALAIGLREWTWCHRVRPEVRVGVAAFAGAVIAPFVVFVSPVARLYWLLTGRQLPGPFGLLTPQPHVLILPLPESRPPEIRELLEQSKYRWEPRPGDIPRWLSTWSRAAQILMWQIPPKDLSAEGKPPS
jgi:hypothetical protein